MAKIRRCHWWRHYWGLWQKEEWAIRTTLGGVPVSDWRPITRQGRRCESCGLRQWRTVE